MIVPGHRLPIVIATRAVDFRHSHDGLAATVQRELGLEPHSAVTVVFRSKRVDSVKILVWDGTGLMLISNNLLILPLFRVQLKVLYGWDFCCRSATRSTN